MGNDGGSIPKRRELVKSAPLPPTTAEAKETAKESLAHRWRTCPLSHLPLRRPVVVDCAGNLYNKDAVLKHLLDDEEKAGARADAERVLGGRVRGLKDVVEVVFAVDGAGRWVCPVTGKELGVGVKSVVVVPCGHAFAREAVRELGKGGEGQEVCVECGVGFDERDVLPLVEVGEEERGRLEKRMVELAERGLSHSLKRVGGKKRKVKRVEETGAVGAVEDGVKATTGSRVVAATAKMPALGTTNAIKNAATASLTARVLAEENERNKKRRMQGGNENLQSLFSKKDPKGKRSDGEFMTRGFSIAADAKYD